MGSALFLSALFGDYKLRKRRNAMPKYFMGGTHLESLERMMMDPSRPDPSRSKLQKKKPRKKPPGSRPAEQHPPEHEKG